MKKRNIAKRNASFISLAIIFVGGIGIAILATSLFFIIVQNQQENTERQIAKLKGNLKRLNEKLEASTANRYTSIEANHDTQNNTTNFKNIEERILILEKKSTHKKQIQ